MTDAPPGAPPTAPAGELSGEDAKLVTLARASLARTGAEQGAAVRDLDGRTYAAASVMLPSLRLSALQVCVAMAVVSGARGLEACVLLREGGDGDLTDDDRRALADLAGPRIPVHLGAPTGRISRTTTT
jgi:hypothetical protein